MLLWVAMTAVGEGYVTHNGCFGPGMVTSFL